MPTTVPASFEKFREAIEPPGYQKEDATTRKDHLVSLLEKDFQIVDAFPTGSLPRYTAVKEHADLDVMVVLNYWEHIEGKRPSEVLQGVRDSLSKYKTHVRKNGQAVTLYYKTWPNVDVVPVSRVDNADGSVSHYKVPDMTNETWIESQPVRHGSEMAERNQSFGPEFKRIVKMIKWWNHQHSSLLQSYHIEVLALNTFDGTYDSYSWNIHKFFERAETLTRSSLWHNIGCVDSYLDSNKKEEVNKRLARARASSHVAWALTYGSNNDHRKAISMWQQIFGEEFPSYG